MPDNRKILKFILKNVQGDKDLFPLEQRSTNSVCFLLTVGFFFAVPLSLLLGAPTPFTLAYVYLGLVYAVFFIIARFWKKDQLVIWLMMVASCIYISFLWFFDGGISGSASSVALLVIILVSPIPKDFQRRIFVLSILLVQGGLYFTQYFYPDFVVAYQSLENQFIGNYLTFIFVAITSTALINYILKNLRKEREQTQQTKRQLKESEYLFRTLSETTSTAIVLCQNQKFSYANPAAQRLYDYSLDELKMMRFQNLLAPEDRDRLQETQQAEGAGEKIISGDEVRILSRSGQEKSVFIEASTIEYYGRPAQLISMLDLTRLRETETDLFNLQNYLSNIIDSMPSILVGVDTSMKITQWNRQAEQQMQIYTEDALGKLLFDSIPHLQKEAQKITRAVMEKRLEENIRMSYEDAGEARFNDITVYPLMDSGFEGAVIRLDDVTERVRLEEMVIQSEKMLSIGGLAAGMAHEINNPLAGILQNVQLAKNRLADNIPANIKAAENAGTSMEVIRNFMENRKIFDQLNNINTAGGRAAKIVENMLSFAKKGRPKELHHLDELLIRSIELAGSDYDLKKQYNFKQIKIITRFDSDVPKVKCEDNKIIQVLFNIISNGAQAMHKSDNPEFIFRLSRTENMAQIEIEDNGPGMTDRVRKRIFEPFFTTKEVNKGTGLGLSLSYFIVVKDHNGEMEVESASGKGAKFIVRLPFNRNDGDKIPEEVLYGK